MKKILLIMIGLSVLLSADFTKSGDIVTDSTTNLQWQDDAIGSQMAWEVAITYCEALELDTLDDWRLPNINELKSIIDRSNLDPAIVDGFDYTSSDYYWSSTTHEGYKNNAWSANFNSGNTIYGTKGNSFFVRCVRAGQ